MLSRETARAFARVGVAAAAVTLVVTTASPAFADTAQGRIESLTPQPDGHLSVVFSATGLGSNASIDPASVTAMIAGQPVTAKATPITAAVDRTTMLTIDVSASMSTPIGTTRVKRIDAAKDAATAYLRSVPRDVKVGLVTFAIVPKVIVAPTQDHAAVVSAVSKLAITPGGTTALYDGTLMSISQLGSTGTRNQLILSDGANDHGATLAKAVRGITSSHSVVDAVSIGADAVGAKQLTALTIAGHGQTVTAADTAALRSYFEQAAVSQSNQLVVDITVPSNVAGSSQQVSISALAGGQTVGDSRVAILPAVDTGVAITDPSFGPQPVAPQAPGVTAQPWFLPAAVGAVALGLFGIAAFAFLSTDRENMKAGRVRRRLSRYSLTPRAEKQKSVATSGALGQSQVARSATELAGRMVATRDLDTGLALKLDAAGVPLRPAEWMLIHIGIAILAGLVFTMLSGFGLLATLLGLVLGLVGPYMYLSVKEGKRKSRFAEQLPGTLQLLSGSIAAGYSLPQAIDTVVRESDGPMAVELNRALVEARLGVPIEDALEATAHRMDSVDFAWVVMAIRIQRQVGGNLSEVLNNVAATMRERERLRRQVQVLSAEGRLSAIILGALPLLFVTYLVLVRPEYISLLVTTPLGIIMIVVGVVLMVGGSFWLRKVVTVEV